MSRPSTRKLIKLNPSIEGTPSRRIHVEESAGAAVRLSVPRLGGDRPRNLTAGLLLPRLLRVHPERDALGLAAGPGLPGEGDLLERRRLDRPDLRMHHPGGPDQLLADRR